MTTLFVPLLHCPQMRYDLTCTLPLGHRWGHVYQATAGYVPDRHGDTS